MSTALESLESILDFIAPYYDKNMKPYYTRDYIMIATHMISNVLLGTTVYNAELRLTVTSEALCEPIISYNKEMILISEPLFAQLINAPIAMFDLKLTFMDNFDICTHKKTTLQRCDEYFGDRLNETLLTIEQKVHVILLMRIALMIQHWRQHILTNTIRTLDHRDFEPVEIVTPIE